MDSDLETASLHDLVERHRAGDRTAMDLLIRRTTERLERLARKMLGAFPQVRDQYETADVLQNALVRLVRALETVKPASVRDYYRLAAEQVRRELLDLARHCRRRPADPLGTAEPGMADDPGLARWAALHEAVENLPVEEREVFGLTFYHGWSQPEIAELLRVSDRQVRRWWGRAVVRLNRVVGEVPDG
jgi:RNA polymerase sigma-70 factor (ECF subfamily)